MNESSAFLAAWVIAGKMTPEEADTIWARLKHQSVPDLPSHIIGQIEAELGWIRGGF